MATLERQVDRFLLREYATSDESLAFVRVMGAAWILVTGAKARTASTVAALPTSFWDPPLGPLRLLDRPPPSWVMQTMTAVLAISMVFLLVGFLTRVVSITGGVALLSLDAIENSFGKIDHGLILISVFFVLMAWSSWGNAFSVDAARGRKYVGSPWPIAVVMLILAVMMGTAAMPKLTSGWLDLDFSASYAHQLFRFVGAGEGALLAQPAVDMDSPVVWELVDWLTVLFEASLLFAVWRRPWYRTILVAACFFHLAVLLTLNIRFASHLVVYAAAFNWKPFMQRLSSIIAGDRGVITFLMILAVGAGVAGWSNGSVRGNAGNVLLVAAGAASVLYVGHLFVWRRLPRRHDARRLDG